MTVSERIIKLLKEEYFVEYEEYKHLNLIEGYIDCNCGGTLKEAFVRIDIDNDAFPTIRIRACPKGWEIEDPYYNKNNYPFEMTWWRSRTYKKCKKELEQIFEGIENLFAYIPKHCWENGLLATFNRDFNRFYSK